MGKFFFHETEIKGMLVIDVEVFGDQRGYFMETYNQKAFSDAGYDFEFVQDNQSKSRKGVLRGLHLQVNNPQGKLVRCIRGEVFDVGVDLRKGSETFGKWHGEILSEENKKQLFIPEGFAHGFLVLSDEAEFCYKCTRLYDPTDELGIRFDDPDINVQWPEISCDYVLSAKDLKQPSFREVVEKLNLR